ncbi:hypothetical protein NG99_06035 [Erwinia typographi]|uniref:Nucleotide-diphospho-sugar transferase domain-containing protein n=1 Tax=Erwinia typographi TaxID=371042 RepID=A0A0A3ZBI3_9GAMM|nr:hypothetical protein [Erwinia typographi]KGT94976.1 hypothetical protein NG99_06035 [Erwinia typographi]
MYSPVFVSFFTGNWIYPQMAERLADSLDGLGLHHDIRGIESGDNWLANTRLKAGFIRQMLDVYPRIVWVDADSDIHKLPHMLLNFREDLFLRPHSTVPGRAWHVSVMGWSSNNRTKALCDDWSWFADAYGGTDEAAFDAVIRRHQMGLTIGSMPLEYHRLPHETAENVVITIGISKDSDKMRIKYGDGFK